MEKKSNKNTAHTGKGLYDYMYSTAELMVAEAEGLVNTLENWRVVDKIILSTKTPEKKKIFGKGNFQTLTGTTLTVSYIQRLQHNHCVLLTIKL